MNKKQKFLGYIKSDLGFFLILLTVLIISFSLLSPKISTELFAFKRQAILNDYINNLKDSGFNSQKYWEFREFYSPGYFNFSRVGIEKNLLKQTREKAGINYNEKNIDLTFLVFSSTRVNSLDMLTKQTDLNKIIDLNKLSKENIIYMDKNSLIYKQNPNTIKIIFLKNGNEMKQVNGFFDYAEKDVKTVKDMNWLNITSVKVN